MRSVRLFADFPLFLPSPLFLLSSPLFSSLLVQHKKKTVIPGKLPGRGRLGHFPRIPSFPTFPAKRLHQRASQKGKNKTRKKNRQKHFISPLRRDSLQSKKTQKKNHLTFVSSTGINTRPRGDTGDTPGVPREKGGIALFYMRVHNNQVVPPCCVFFFSFRSFPVVRCPFPFCLVVIPRLSRRLRALPVVLLDHVNNKPKRSLLSY